MVLLPHNPGDVVMGLYMVAHFRSLFPAAHIDYLVGEESRSLIENHPDIRNCFVLPQGKLKRAWQQDQISEAILATTQFLREVEKNSYDLILNLFQDPFGALLTSLLPSNKVIGYTYHPSGCYQVQNRALEYLFSIPVQREANPYHSIDIFFRALSQKPKGWVKPQFPANPRFFTPKAGLPPIEILFQLGSAWPGKKWPLAYWSRLFEILATSGHPVGFIGSPQEIPLWENFLTSLSSQGKSLATDYAHNFIGQTELLDLPSLLAQAKWLVTGDTVSMHMAASLPTKVLALFGGSNPVETGPYGPENFVFQASTDIPEKLPLEVSNENLNRISPEVVGHFILYGKIPTDVFCWQTHWDWTHQCQIWIDANMAAHPFQRNIAQMEKIWSGPPQTKSFLSEPGQIGGEMVAQLKKCLENPSQENLLALSALDKKLEEETRHNLIWEAYRIHVNGLPLSPLTNYCHLRLEAWER